MASYASLAALFSAIASAIRAKTGQSAQIVANDFPDAIAAIPSGGGGTSAILHPIHKNVHSGYVTNSWWVPLNPPQENCSADIYQLTRGHHYLVGLGAVIGNRFRVGVYDVDPITATENLAGSSVGSDTDSPSPYMVRSVYTATANNYLAFFKANNGTGDAAVAFVLDLDLITVP